MDMKPNNQLGWGQRKHVITQLDNNNWNRTINVLLHQLKSELKISDGTADISTAVNWGLQNLTPANTLEFCAPLYRHGLTLCPAWICNHMPRKVWDGNTYPFLNFNGCTVEVQDWISNFIPHFMMDVIILSMLGSKLIMLVKGATGDAYMPQCTGLSPISMGPYRRSCKVGQGIIWPGRPVSGVALVWALISAGKTSLREYVDMMTSE